MPPRTSDDESPDIDAISGVIDDEACRAIITALDRPMTVPEIAEETGLPLSTTYKKLDDLSETSLVRETTPIASSRHGKSRYVTDFSEIAIELADDRSFRVRVERVVGQAAELWSDVTPRF